MKIFSWNVNGIRAVHNKELFLPFVEKYKPDIICLQETKATREQVLKEFGSKTNLSHLDELQGETEQQTESYDKYGKGVAEGLTKQIDKKNTSVTSSASQQGVLLDRLGYKEYWNSAIKKGYSGTAIFSKTEPISVVNGLPDDIIKKHKLNADSYGNPNEEGRIITAEYEKFYLVTVYTPNAKDDLSRVALRQKQWDPAFLTWCKQLEKTKPVVFCGDLNVAHTADDLARPKENIGKKGFTAEEIEGFDNFEKAGFVDTLRIFHKGNGHYTWWTHWANARARNVGWRIDYFMVSGSLKSKVKSADIHPEQMGSDHCPISIELDV